MATTKTMAPATISINPITETTILIAVRGTRPLILNRLAEKARQELLLPSGRRRTTADRAASLKHDPYAEFRSSPYRIRDDAAPSLLGIPAGAFKGAMMAAALRIPGAKKTEVGNLISINGGTVPVFGVPDIFSTIVRSADMNRTPDVRTRAIVPHWVAMVSISFVQPLITQKSVINLLSGAGLVSGVGDWRREKGKGDYGSFVVVDADDPEFNGIVKAGGRAVQIAAMDDPMPYDDETEELLSWFDAELTNRGKVGTARETIATFNGEETNGHERNADSNDLAAVAYGPVA